MNKKLEILSRLIKADQITMEELFILADKNEQLVPYVPPYQPWTVPNPPWNGPWVGTTQSPYNAGKNPFTTICLSDFPMSKTVTEYVKAAKN